MILNHLPFSAYSGVLKFDMKIFVNVARLEIGQLFTQGAKWWHPCTLDTFLVTLYARSFRRRFFAFHHAVNHPQTHIILSWLSIPLVLKCAAKTLKIVLKIKNLMSKMFLNKDFAQAREIIQTSLSLDSSKFVFFFFKRLDPW